MIKVEENKHYHFELYEGKGFNAKVLEIKDVKIKLSNKETIEFKDIQSVLEYWPYEEPTFYEVEFIAKKAGYKLVERTILERHYDCLDQYAIISEYETVSFDYLIEIVEYLKDVNFTVITKELTFEDVKKLANENGYELKKHKKKGYKEYYMLYSKEIEETKTPFHTLQEVAAYFYPF